MPNTTRPIDITDQLDTVSGGAAGRAIMKGLRTAGDALERVGGWVGGAVGLKEGYDWLRGGNSGGGNTGGGNTGGGNTGGGNQNPASAPAGE